MNKELLERIIDSLYDMTNYADDGIVSRQDPDFKEFYDKVDKARELLNELNTMLEKSNEFMLEVERLYDEHLMKTENRGISYGEITHIESLTKEELNKLYKELLESESEL